MIPCRFADTVAECFSQASQRIGANVLYNQADLKTEEIDRETVLSASGTSCIHTPRLTGTTGGVNDSYHTSLQEKHSSAAYCKSFHT